MPLYTMHACYWYYRYLFYSLTGKYNLPILIKHTTLSLDKRCSWKPPSKLEIEKKNIFNQLKHHFKAVSFLSKWIKMTFWGTEMNKIDVRKRNLLFHHSLQHLKRCVAYMNVSPVLTERMRACESGTWLLFRWKLCGNYFWMLFSYRK